MIRGRLRTLLLSAGVACALSDANAEARRASAAQLAWLAGCWAYVGGEPGSGETWTPPAGGALFSTSRTVRGGRVVSYEFQRIVEEDGSLAFYASPSGQPEVRFALKSLSAHEVVFDNPDNDFPQRVIYRLSQSGDVSARIEGARDDPTRGIAIPMKRTSCEKASEG